MSKRIVAGLLVLGLGAVAACSQATAPGGATSQCVDIPDVDLFTVENGKFVPAGAAVQDMSAGGIPALVAGLGFDWMSADRSGATVNVRGEAPSAEAKRTGFLAARNAVMAHPDSKEGRITTINDRINVADGSGAMEARMKQAFGAAGFPWLDLNIRGKVATLTGTAPNAGAKEQAYTLGRAAIESDSEISSAINVIVDGIAVAGGDAGIGAALAGLPSDPTVAQCQTAFGSVMSGRNVEFDTGSASISPSSARLLDAASGVALLCGAYTIEIGGHTDSRGAEQFNLDLSQSRADSVRLYLIEKSVPAEGLSAVGYGETRPLDASSTQAAHEKNRRTEFVVRER